jgi:hypothetical protein
MHRQSLLRQGDDHTPIIMPPLPFKQLACPPPSFSIPPSLSNSPTPPPWASPPRTLSPLLHYCRGRLYDSIPPQTPAEVHTCLLAWATNGWWRYVFVQVLQSKLFSFFEHVHCYFHELFMNMFKRCWRVWKYPNIHNKNLNMFMNSSWTSLINHEQFMNGGPKISSSNIWGGNTGLIPENIMKCLKTMWHWTVTGLSKSRKSV